MTRLFFLLFTHDIWVLICRKNKNINEFLTCKMAQEKWKKRQLNYNLHVIAIPFLNVNSRIFQLGLKFILKVIDDMYCTFRIKNKHFLVNRIWIWSQTTQRNMLLMTIYCNSNHIILHTKSILYNAKITFSVRKYCTSS